MKFKIRFFTSVIVVIFSFGFVQGFKQDFSKDISMNIGPIEVHAAIIIAFLPLFAEAGKLYIEKNNIEPVIKCRKCTSKQLGMSEFGGGLIGMALKDTVDGKNNYNQTKALLHDFLKVVSEGSHANIINHMLYVYNEIYRVCPFCGFDGKGDTWQEVKIVKQN